jgi:hypothetical protein
MTFKIGFKVVCGVMAALLYGLGAQRMLDGAKTIVDYTPNDFTEWLVTAAATALIAFIAAQIGVTVAQSGTPFQRMHAALHGATTTRTDSTNTWTWAVIALIAADFLVLTIFGVMFIRLAITPEDMMLPSDGKALTEAPDYITLQAKAFVALVLAGAAGVTAGSLNVA